MYFFKPSATRSARAPTNRMPLATCPPMVSSSAGETPAFRSIRKGMRSRNAGRSITQYHGSTSRQPAWLFKLRTAPNAMQRSSFCR